MTEITIGIDISKAYLDVHRLPEATARRFANTKVGIKAFLTWIGQDKARLVYEPTGPYHQAFEAACAKAGLVMCKVNPLHARRFAQCLGRLAKSDAIDAAMLARMGQIIDLPQSTIADQTLRSLKELFLAYQCLIKERTRLKNRMQTVSLPLLKAQHKRRHAQIQKDSAALLQAIADQIAADPTLAGKLQIITSIPGIADITAFALIIEMPELGTIDNKKAASLAGLVPFVNQSGSMNRKATCKGGRGQVMQALYMPALVAIRFNKDLKAKYKELTQAGKPPKVAITAIMRKLITIANALLKKNRLWQEIRP